MRNIKKTYLLLLIVISLVGVATYSTYALFTSSLEIGDITLDTELKYTFKINSNQEFTIGANSKLRFNAIVENDMEGTISYGVYYKMVSPTSINDNITIAEVSDSETLTTSGPIESGSANNIIVPLVIINNSNEEIKVQIGVRTGYYTEAMTPSDIIYENGELLISDIIDSETAGTYQCDVSDISKECTNDCYVIVEDGKKNKYCYCITESEISKNLDTSGANVPELTDNLVPVMHNGTTWVTADEHNVISEYAWYDYNSRKWANAVLLTATKRNSLTKNSDGTYVAGQTIGDTESGGVLAFYVWIPRYKYKVWNKDKIIGTDSYDAQNIGIDVEFIGKDEEGTITCEYSYAAPVETAGKPNETCTGNNGDYYTHPAFKFGNDNLSGIWIGKFELSSSTPDSGYAGGGNSVTLTPRVLPNTRSWRNNTLTNYWKVIKDMQASNNIYGLTTDLTVADTHMITNLEWGAVAYLTHSKYGRCIENVCTETALNSYYKGSGTSLILMTGCGPQSSGNTNSGTTCNAYTTSLGLSSSTTGNIYGIYDMSGGSQEYVMGSMSSQSGSYVYNVANAGSNYTYTGYEKYLTTYAYVATYYGQIAYNSGRLGDAISEVVTDSNDHTWYGDYASFPYVSWFVRGGSYNSKDNAGLFDSSNYYSYEGNPLMGSSTHSSLIVFFPY